MKRLTRLITICAFLSVASIANAESLVVIVHKNNPNSSITRSQLIDLFMGKYVAFPDSQVAQPVDNKDASGTKAEFYKQLVGLSVARINAYWSRIKFTGRARPPLEYESHSDVLSYVKENENAIAYIPKTALTDEVKVIFQFDE